MILVTGSILGRPDSIDELLKLSLEHVHRSRKEPGCISHAVARDAENPLLLSFTEQWADKAALAAHFAVPASSGFVKALGALAAASPQLDIYEAAAIKLS